MTLHPPSLPVWVPFVRQAATEVDNLPFRGPGWTSTYPGHGELYRQHGGAASGANRGQLAVDFMVSSRAQGDRIADYLWENRERLGLRYIIWWRRIRSRTRDGAWHEYVNPVASKRGTASGDHTNHVHASFFLDGTFTPLHLTPSAPSGTVPATTGKAFMSDRIDFYAREDQALVPGDNVAWLGPLAADGQHPLSLVSKPTADVDITATVDVRGMDGEPYAGPYALVFRTVAYQKGTPTTTVGDELAVLGSNQARYAGPFTTAPAKGKSNRLRLVLVVPEGVTGLVLHRVAFSGWTA